MSDPFWDKMIKRSLASKAAYQKLPPQGKQEWPKDSDEPPPVPEWPPAANPLEAVYYILYDAEGAEKQRGIMQRVEFDAAKTDGYNIIETDDFGVPIGTGRDNIQ